MNYFAHGCECLDNPYFLAGTAVPDWLSVVDRRVRVRPRSAELFVADPDPRVSSIACGIGQHHSDDAWFHETPAFAELSLEFCLRLRDLLAPDDGFRPHFVGHILVEMLLDAALIAHRPQRLDQYYAALSTLDPRVVQVAVNRMATCETDRLEPFVPLFVQERFLWDYADDARLLRRLNQVMRRVNLPQLPERTTRFLASAREIVSRRISDLIPAAANTAVSQSLETRR